MPEPETTPPACETGDVRTCTMACPEHGNPEPDTKIRAPFTPEQVAALNQFQQYGGMHPFTCGNEQHDVHYILIARTDGWHCSQPPCDYRQVWAHAFMADPDAWPKPFPRGITGVHPTSEPYAYGPPPALSWAQSVASHGIGDTATIDIDIHLPGHDEPVPVEIPIGEAQTLHAMLGGALAEHVPAPSVPGLRDTLAAWCRDHALDDLGEQVALDSLEAVVQPYLDRLAADQERYEDETVGRFNQQATNDRRRAAKAEAALARVRGISRRLAAHAKGFQDVLDDSDRAPWAGLVRADLEELTAALTPPADQPDTGGAR